MSVEQLLKEQGMSYKNIRLGEVELNNIPQPSQLNSLGQALESIGFELLDDQRQQQIEKIRNLLIQKVQEADIEEHFSISKYLTTQLHKDYSHMSRLFSEVEGITIEQFFILQKIEKVKEWLIYNQLSLGEIAWKLGYSSVQHLSSQFKKVTGMTPGAFKKIGAPLRKPLDGVREKHN
jgi:AraC-like DNA-binding protein